MLTDVKTEDILFIGFIGFSIGIIAMMILRIIFADSSTNEVEKSTTIEIIFKNGTSLEYKLETADWYEDDGYELTISRNDKESFKKEEIVINKKSINLYKIRNTFTNQK